MLRGNVYSRRTAAGKRVQAMGGAKNHSVILPDADLERATKDSKRMRTIRGDIIRPPECRRRCVCDARPNLCSRAPDRTDARHPTSLQ